MTITKIYLENHKKPNQKMKEEEGKGSIKKGMVDCGE